MNNLSPLERHGPPTLAAALTAGAFRLVEWIVEPSLGRISADGVERLVEPKTMNVLVQLAARPGQVVSSDELIDSVWRGRPMGDNPVHKCVSQLRDVLRDDRRRPRYIATIPRKGYRLLAPVERLALAPEIAAGSRPLQIRIDISFSHDGEGSRAATLPFELRTEDVLGVLRMIAQAAGTATH